MRWLQAGTMLLGAVMYAFVIAFSGQLSSAGNLYWNFFLIGYWNTLLMVVTALVIRDSYLKVRAGETLQLATDAFVVKLAAIPFFLLNYFVLANLAAAGALILIFGGAVLLFAVWAGSVLTYLTMLSTSIPLWAAIVRLRRDKVIGTGLTVLYMILSFIFVTDVVAAILAFGHSRRRPGLALVFVLVALGAIVALPGLLVNDLPDMPGSTLVADSERTLDWLMAAGIVAIVVTVAVALIRMIARRPPLNLRSRRAVPQPASTRETLSDGGTPPHRRARRQP